MFALSLVHGGQSCSTITNAEKDWTFKAIGSNIEHKT